MHWIQNLREQLQITQEDLGHYLQLSYHTIKSVEQGRRILPTDSLNAAAALFDAVRNAQANRVAVYPQMPACRPETRRTRQLHKQCCRQLDQSINELDKMKKSHASACFALGVFQVLAQSLPTPVSQEEHFRIEWAQAQIKNTMQRINDTSPAMQDLLAAEIVELKNIAHSLDLIQLNDEHNTPIKLEREPINL